MVEAGRPAGAPLEVPNLFQSFSQLAELASLELVRPGLDGFLLLAGLNQITEDYLQRDPGPADKVIRRLGRHPGTQRALVGVRGLAVGARSHLAGARRTSRWQAQLEAILTPLAARILDDGVGVASPALTRACRLLLDRTSHLPAGLQQRVLRLPSCFRSFDQQPEDLLSMVDQFALTWGQTDRPVTVVGARTSGSYLAPLLAAALGARGFSRVAQTTCRPGLPLGRRQEELLRSRRDGLYLIIDDPPISGSTYTRVAELLTGLGVPTASIIMFTCLAGRDEQVPDRLRSAQRVTLPFAEWKIQEQLQPESVRSSLGDLLLGRETDLMLAGGRRMCVSVAAIGLVSHLSLPDIPDVKGGSGRRRHVRAHYRVEVFDGRSGEWVEAEIYVKGVGIGYFGGHSLAQSRRLAEFLPPVYGVSGGCLFRGWLPEETRISAQNIDALALAPRLAAYASARRRRLALSADTSEKLGDQHPAWRVAADWLRLGLGRAGVLATPGLHQLSRQLLRVPQPAVIDGNMAVSRWYGTPGTALKVDYDERGLEVHSSDVVFDLARIATDFDTDGGAADLGAPLRHEYERATGEKVSEERWLVLRVVSLLSYLKMLHWSHLDTPSAAEQRALRVEMDRVTGALSRLHNRLLTATYLSDVTPVTMGPICAIDIDGVLETMSFGYPATSPAGARSLRALALHGYRAVLASGRSLAEVRERCVDLRLSAGVAEYGAALYQMEAPLSTSLLNAGQEERRAALIGWPGWGTTELDPTYTHIVRACGVGPDGGRRRIDDQLLHRASQAAGSWMTPVIGTSQVDFVPVGVNKATGLWALLSSLGNGDGLAMAIGDQMSDLPMLRLARRPFVPANGARELEEMGLPRLHRAAQGGLFEAVSQLIGHAPGGCSTCRTPPTDRSRQALLRVLGAEDRSRAGKLLQAARLDLGLRR
jgi:hydroxymethylpyrimidine pyrophosphatase-like HAD family hydrolase